MDGIKDDTEERIFNHVPRLEKNQYCESDYTTQSDLQIQCNTYQTTNGILHRTRTKILEFVWKYKRP